ncbi:Serine/threonine protein kinase [Phytophthora cinnamomi]|uniref:Serine/threonine protein kinase n=1 Tax=Phytophthora cinnamomi TaxID=4785 RepID=UPI00355A9EBD|nr:Serine/threonine protein kinase [Phytophthora cinnamomi]
MVIRYTGAIVLLANLLRTGKTEQHGHAVIASEGLTWNSRSNVRAIVEGGIVPSLILLVRSGTHMQREFSATVLGRLANTSAKRKLIANAGAIAPFVGLLTTGTNGQKEEAAVVLGQLAINNDDNKRQIEAEGGHFCKGSFKGPAGDDNNGGDSTVRVLPESIKSLNTFRSLKRIVTRATKKLSEHVSLMLPMKSRIQVWIKNEKPHLVKMQLGMEHLSEAAFQAAPNFKYYDDCLRQSPLFDIYEDYVNMVDDYILKITKDEFDVPNIISQRASVNELHVKSQIWTSARSM